MIHFVRSGGRIPADHLSYIVNHFEREGLDHVVHDQPVRPEDIVDNDAYVSCDMGMDALLEPVRDRIFQVQLPHNLTGLKGSDFYRSQANLNILAGRQVAHSYGVDLTDPRFMVGGYAKWDTIYPERFKQELRRREIAAEMGLDMELPWAVFYPTGPNVACRGNQYRAPRIYGRLQKDLGELEYIFCNHARNRDDPEARQGVQQLRRMAQSDPRIHIVDGGDSLRFVSACNVFITDIASTLITALSMEKPIVFIAIEHNIKPKRRVEGFQCGYFLKDVTNFFDFITTYAMPQPLRDLLASCVAYDDDRNCERLAGIILERYESWLKQR